MSTCLELPCVILVAQKTCDFEYSRFKSSQLRFEDSRKGYVQCLNPVPRTDHT